MELLAAVLGVRFAASILQSHDVKINKATYWSDSKTVLKWIRSDPLNYKQFVMFRIGEIQEATKADQWNYVPTKINVADLATKAAASPAIDVNSTWFEGPSFLKLPKEEWPKWTVEKCNEQSEMKQKIAVNFVGVHTEASPVVDTTRFSKWERLLRSTAYVRLFIDKLRKKNDVKNQTTIGQQQLQWAENYLFRAAQNEAFGEEMAALQIDANSKISKKSGTRIEMCSLLA